MPRFTANLTMLWPELDVYDRFRAAAQAGFRRVEILFVHALDPARVERELRENGLTLVLFDPAPGNWEGGERGLLSLPGREEEFLRTVREAVAAARRFGTRRLNALVGIPRGVAPEQARRTAVGNLRAAIPVVESIGATLLVEAINSIDMPGYFADTVDRAAALVEEAASPSVRLQLDQYHAGMMGTDPVAALRKHAALVAHAQIADVPGRNQPGTGTQPIGEFLDELDRLGYSGSVGLEYKPRGSMDEALAWLPRERRG
ncbi:MAG TPA: TIM barrel protein [Myxococcales bacterium]|nr:TIM barrel protein [Myxococcales bacterium]